MAAHQQGRGLPEFFHVGALALVLWISKRRRVEKDKEVAVKLMLPLPTPLLLLPPAIKRATRVERVQRARGPETAKPTRCTPKQRSSRRGEK